MKQPHKNLIEEIHPRFIISGADFEKLLKQNKHKKKNNEIIRCA